MHPTEKIRTCASTQFVGRALHTLPYWDWQRYIYCPRMAALHILPPDGGVTYTAPGWRRYIYCHALKTSISCFGIFWYSSLHLNPKPYTIHPTLNPKPYTIHPNSWVVV